MSSVFMFSLIAGSVLVMIIAISVFKQHPFLFLLLVAIATGLLSGMPAEEVIATIKTGFGNILAGIGIVIIAGTIIGTILEKTGAALSMATAILKLVGEKRSVATMGITGYITGIPVFCDSGFVILSPIAKALSKQTHVSLAVMATVLSGGLYATHCLVPPTPGPIAMAGTLHADLGLTILIGLCVSVPATLAALVYAKKIASKITLHADSSESVQVDDLIAKYGKLPGVFHSFIPIILPIILITLKSIADFPSYPFGSGVVKAIVSFFGNPVTALILGVFIALTLIPTAEKGSALAWINDGITNSANILAITAAGGSFGAILAKMPIAEALSGSLLFSGLGVFLPFLLAAILKTALGSSTVSMITTSALLAPMMESLGFVSPLGKVLVLMAIGAGSMTVSHANDSYFWVVSQFSGMDTKTAYKCQTGVTGVMGITSVLVVFLLSLFIH
ncbi:GntP family permease [Treponema phagedenis]|uniref:GntP family permease n=1 Tax=Treponema phagedenis TaxID=162 RepID=UPI0002F929C8|nr:GntP family permease [Treponema phagedenis]